MSARSLETLIIFATWALAASACGEVGEQAPAPEADPGETDQAPDTKQAAETAPRPAQKPPGTVVTDLLALDLPESDDTFDPGQAVWTIHSTGDPPVWVYGKVVHQERRGRFRVSVTADGTQELPTPFVHAAAPALGLRPGFPITVDTEGSARFGRVQSISGTDVRVKYVLDHDNIATGAFSTADIRPLGRRALEPGIPVVFSGGGHSFIGVLALATGEKAYVICGDLLELARTEVTPLDTLKLLKPGDRVIAVPKGNDTCEAFDGEVIEMKDGGLQYTVELVRGGKIDAPFALVARHPSLPRPKAP